MNDVYEVQKKTLQRVFHTIVCLGCVAYLLAPCRLSAEPDPPYPVPVSTDSTMDTTPVILPTSLATITTDTGALAPGHRDFSRYQTPDLCVASGETTRAALQRTLAAQTAVAVLQRNPEYDTLPVGVGTVARFCGARFTVANTRIAALPDLFALALLEANDTLAHAALARFAATQLTDSARQHVLLDFMQKYLTAEPPRVKAAEAIAAQLDVSGRSARVAAIHAHGQLLDFAMVTLNRERMQEEAEHIFALAHDLTAKEFVDYSINRYVMPNRQLRKAWEVMMQLAGNDQLAMLAVAQRAHAEWNQLKAQGVTVPVKGLNPALFVMFDRFATEPIDSLVKDFRPKNTIVNGTSMPILHAAFWFPAGHDTVRPAPGKVSLIINIPSVCLRAWNIILWWRSPCPDFMGQLQQWQEKYGDSGLQITVMASLQGFVLYSGPETPQEEARDIAWFVREYWKLPVTVAVHDTVTSDGGNAEDDELSMTLTDKKTATIYSDKVGWSEQHVLNSKQIKSLDLLIARTITTQSGGDSPAAPAPTVVSPVNHQSLPLR